MNRFFYLKLAADNIKKNAKNYIPYILTCIFTVTMFYIMRSLSVNDGIDKLLGADTITYTMGFGCWIVGIFALIFLFYTNSFLMKRRKKEFGLFNILGMEKKHISRVIGIETIYITILSLTIGIFFGILLDKAMYLFLVKLINQKITLGFYVSWDAIALSVILFCSIFLLIFLNSLRQIHLTNPIELLKAGNVGEREPKSKWLLTLLGVICLSVGYYISLTTENIMKVVSLFFVAVLLVIVGTYLLFTAGSITLLKLLRKNNNYFYQTKHFVSVSGMIYRMKQNAVGLASICILSTMVLIMVSSTTSMMMEVNNIVNFRFPYDISVSIPDKPTEKNDKMLNIVHDVANSFELKVKSEVSYTSLLVYTLQNGSVLDNDYANGRTQAPNSRIVFFIPLSDYNKASGENKILQEGEILIYSGQTPFKYETLQVLGQDYRVKERLEKLPNTELLMVDSQNIHFIIVEDIDELTRLSMLKKDLDPDNGYPKLNTDYGFDITKTDDKELQKSFNDKLLSTLVKNEQIFSHLIFKSESASSFESSYAGLFFLGIFLGTLFIMATILIIYYKQISEGYDDKERFEIMQKVGMSYAEVKKSIHSQIITVFFLPLFAAGIHVAFAFPIISRILKLLFLENTPLFITCTIACFLVFAILYAIIYSITAKTYYRIVSR